MVGRRTGAGGPDAGRRVLGALLMAVLLAGCDERVGLASAPVVVGPPPTAARPADELPPTAAPQAAGVPGLTPGDVDPSDAPTPDGDTAPPGPPVAPPGGPRSAIVEQVDFETGDVAQWRNPCGGGGCVEASSEHVRAGRYAMKAVLPPGQERTEGAGEFAAPGSEHWYGWSVYVPEEWPQGAGGIISQVHAGIGYGAAWQLLIEDEQLSMWRRYQPAGAAGPDKSHALREYRHDLAPLQRGRWLDVVLHARWSHRQDGLLEVWLDGELVWTVQGSVYFDLPPGEGPYFKAGIYGYGDSARGGTRTLWVDEFRRGDAAAGYAGVAPGGGPAGE